MTLEPAERLTRLTVRASRGVRPILRRLSPTRWVLDLPEIGVGQLPEELPVEGQGLRSVRVRTVERSARLELELDAGYAPRLVSAVGNAEVVVDVAAAGAPPVKPVKPVLPVTPRPPTQPPVSPPLTPMNPAKPLVPVKPPEPPPVTPMPLPTVPPDTRPRLTGVLLQPSGGKLTLRLATTGRVTLTSGVLRGPAPRCYVDVRGALLGDPLPELPEPLGRVRSVRIGQLSQVPPVARVVLDLLPGTDPRTVAPAGRSLASAVFPEGVFPPPVPVKPAAPRPVAFRWVVAVDAGHGGADPGARSASGIREKTVALDVALRLGRYLTARGCRVRYSRERDRSLPPPQRARWLRATPSHVLVSVHCDSILGRPGLAGSTTYFHQGSSSSRGLAERVQEEMVSTIRSPDLGVRSDYTRYEGGFYMLRYAGRPAVLVETGYLSHAGTARKLNTAEHRQKLAEGIGQGVLAYLQGRR